LWFIFYALSCSLFSHFIFLTFFITKSAAARIGEGILLDHGTGLVIGETAIVGNWVSLMQVPSITQFLLAAKFKIKQYF
jgi:serine acetyltransferase